MIQRIQSIWLLLAAVFAFISLQQPFFTGSILGQPATEFRGIDDILVMILTIVTGVLSVVSIFMYKNRNKQLMLVVFDLVISIFLIASYFMKTKSMLGNVSIQAVFVFIIPIFLLFAIRGIARDKKLIKSVDRLRN